MGDFRLICPGCGAEYRLDPGLIPASGRQVECSACGRVWHQPGLDGTPVSDRDRLQELLAQKRSERAAPHDDAPAEQPTPPIVQPLTRRLPPDVLSILTEEAERERQARAVEATPLARTVAEWPATTVSAPATAPAVVAPAAPDVAAEPAVAPPPDPAPAPLSPHAAPVAADRHLPAVTPATLPAAEIAHRRGFRAGLLLCLALLVLYVVAAYVPADNPLGAARAGIDGWRHWLATVLPGR